MRVFSLNKPKILQIHDKIMNDKIILLRNLREMSLKITKLLKSALF